MKHTTLYRKWRPRRFGGIVGQEPVVRTLRRAIETDRVSHAYLFSGPRGTGKTSTAKVLAMGLNCEKGPTPEPDGTCESCRAIMGNSSIDVLEMDAASNRGIDEIRDLRDKVNLAPAAARMKVYIIDEVHMLTAEAFNALLKMLEEPPEHVVFVLATTEKHRVLPTIISRCQSFDFRRPSIETLAQKLKEIAEVEGIEVEPEALTVIAREGRGSFRDAEGLLDQLSSFAEGEITASMVRELLGGVGPEALIETTYALYERRAADALRMVDRLSSEGKDLGQFVAELLAHLRNLMLLPHAPEVALAGVGAEERAPLEAQASTVPTAEVVRLIEALGDSLGRIKRGGDPKLELELVFLKLAREYTEPDVEALLGRLERLEKAVENGDLAPRSAAPASAHEEVRPVGREPAQDAPDREDIASGQAGSHDTRSEGVQEESPASTEDSGNEQSTNFSMVWDRVIRSLAEQRPDIAAVYKEAALDGFEDGIVKLSFPEELSIYTRLAVEPKREKVLRELLAEHLGESPRLQFRVAGDETTPTAIGSQPRRAASSERPGQRPVSGSQAADTATTDTTEVHPSRPQPTPEASSPEMGNANGSVSDDGTRGRKESGDTIREESEVFEVAREAGLFEEGV